MRKLAFLLALSACGTAVDPAGLPSIEGYESWYEFDPPDIDVPGHANSSRDFYINDMGRSYPHGGRYPIGTVIVKEIYNRDSDLNRTDLRYIGVMRKVGKDADVGAPVEGGWVFTEIPERGGSETSFSLCWNCHKQAPFDGAWYDYGE